MFDRRYDAQVRLLIRCLPEIGRYPCFALKGGTAINLFVRDLPRLSVDVDLTYLPLKPRMRRCRRFKKPSGRSRRASSNASLNRQFGRPAAESAS